MYLSKARASRIEELADSLEKQGSELDATIKEISSIMGMKISDRIEADKDSFSGYDTRNILEELLVDAFTEPGLIEINNGKRVLTLGHPLSSFAQELNNYIYQNNKK